MRKISFRGITTGKEKRFAYGLVSNIDPDKGTATIHDTRKNISSEVELETVGQYTGMRDDSGREIYEGDILSFKDYDTFAAEVIFDEGQYLVFVNGSYRGLTEIIENFRSLKVIGNVHENPGLLDEYN